MIDGVVMQRHQAIICAAVLLCPSLCAAQVLAQAGQAACGENAQSAQSNVTPAPTRHSCFDQPDGTRNALHRLPASAHFWLSEDVVYVITSEERCAFLHVNTDEERDQFIEQFWYRRASDPNSPDNDFKIEHYRRIAFVNEKYGSQLPGWKTDRGRIYIIFGPSDSVEPHEAGEKTDKPPDRGPEAQPFPMEKWHYRYIEGIGENVVLDFEYSALCKDYRLVLPESDPDRLLRADVSHPFGNLGHSNPTRSTEKFEIYVGPMQAPRLRFKDLEAIVTSQIVREQVHFHHRFEFLGATNATTLARLGIELPSQAHPPDGQMVAYELFVRVSKPSGWVVDTSELTAGEDAHVDVPLAPGTYRLAIVAKNVATGEVGVVRTSFDVPTYEALEKTGSPAALSPFVNPGS